MSACPTTGSERTTLLEWIAQGYYEAGDSREQIVHRCEQCGTVFAVTPADRPVQEVAP